MDPKERPNHDRYLRVLASMTFEQRMMKAFELSALARATFRDGLRKRFPDMPEAEFHQLYLERLALCHNRDY